MSEIIKIKINGVEYDTYIDEHGTQRFFENPNHFLVKQLKDYGGTEDMDSMCMKYHRGEFNQKDYAEFHMGVGYSVYGWSTLSHFANMLIINPLWIDEEEDSEFAGMDDSYLYGCLTEGDMTLKEVFDTMMKRDDITLDEAHLKFCKDML